MKILTVDCNAADAPKLFTESLINTGFAICKNHPISTKLFDEVYSEWRTFFASNEKFNYLFDKEKQDGYFPISVSEKQKGNTIKDIKEFYNVYAWGRYPTLLSERTRELYNQLSSFAGNCLSWIEQHTPPDISKQFPMPLSSMIQNSERTLLRILNYPPLTGNEEPGAVRAAAHEDINLITLLIAATSPGLQVLDSHDNWHNLSCDTGMIVVNVGDMLQMCSQGYFRSTTHRVVNPVGSLAQQSRLSIPLFLHPRDEVRLSKTHTAKSYLFERLNELGLL